LCTRGQAATKGNTFSTRRNRVRGGNGSQNLPQRHGDTEKAKEVFETSNRDIFSDEHYWVEQLEENEVTENVKNFFSGPRRISRIVVQSANLQPRFGSGKVENEGRDAEEFNHERPRGSGSEAHS
jgi:hypothetical protein